MKKRIAILGSTGSIGTQALEVIHQNPEKFEVEVLTANNNVDILIAQAKQFQPNAVVIANAEKYKVDIDTILELRKNLIDHYVVSLDYYNVDKMKNWLEQKEETGLIKLNKISDTTKINYA